MSVMNRLFPDLKIDSVWKLVNLNELHNQTGATKPIVEDTKAQEALIRQSLPHVYTYGGFGEDRDNLWFGLKQPAIHLGVDFNNLPIGLSVKSLTDGKVIHIMRDQDKVNGWGGRVMVQTIDQKHVVLYGHLDHQHLPVVGSTIKAGDEVGKIGNSFENGGWFCHLHLQYMTSSYVQPFLSNLDLLDGYASTLPSGVLDPLTVFSF